jgi:hypothetical protein
VASSTPTSRRVLALSETGGSATSSAATAASAASSVATAASEIRSEVIRRRCPDSNLDAAVIANDGAMDYDARIDGLQLAGNWAAVGCDAAMANSGALTIDITRDEHTQPPTGGGGALERPALPPLPPQQAPALSASTAASSAARVATTASQAPLHVLLGGQRPPSAQSRAGAGPIRPPRPEAPPDSPCGKYWTPDGAIDRPDNARLRAMHQDRRKGAPCPCPKQWSDHHHNWIKPRTHSRGDCLARLANDIFGGSRSSVAGKRPNTVIHL